VDVSTPLFISYSRKDYYFAESLAFHLSRAGVPVWFDARDLSPGGFWQRDLDAALDRASCLLLLASADSLNSPHVRHEWERSRAQRKRIVILLLRGARLPDELASYEFVDFQGAFTPALRRLVLGLRSRLATYPKRRNRFSLKLPPWVLAIALTLCIPILCYFALANWTEDSREQDTPFLRTSVRLLLPVFASVLLWFLGFAWLRRRMGMTHLITCFAFTWGWTLVPLVRVWLYGPTAVAKYGQPMGQVITGHSLGIEILGALPLAGVFIVFVLQPEDLLRWMPTGRVWNWYRARSTFKFPELTESSILKRVGRFRLLNDPLDNPAASRLRKELEQTGARDVPNSNNAVILLTNRTRTQWLIHNAQHVPGRVMTVIGTSIALPEEVNWVWRREWIDFRNWDLNRLDRKSGLLAVPEAVTGVRLPRPAWLAHHLLCSMAALAMMLTNLSDLNPGDQSRDNSSTEPIAILACSVLVWNVVLARRLVRRTISERNFFRFWPLSPVLVAVIAVSSFHDATSHGIGMLPAVVVAVFLATWIILWRRNRPQLTFWFPSSTIPSPKRTPTLNTKRNWQTLIWISAYLFFWYFVQLL
jgi:TIR domain